MVDKTLLSRSSSACTRHRCDGANTAETVYELTPAGSTWTYKSLYVFSGNKDGLYSFSNVVFDKQGNLYGTTNRGGTNGYGVVFKVKP